jgi:hypothetical protein
LTALFPPLPADTRRTLDRLPGLIDEAFPLPARFRAGLKWDVAELSRLLTSGREERGGSYLGRPALLSAYLRYFMPWNVYRLSRLFGSLPLGLKPGDSVNDFGAGPLTLASALWISRPELRTVPLEFRCFDRTPAVLEAGRKFFTRLADAVPPASNSGGEAGASRGASCPWIIRTIRGEIRRGGGLSAGIRGKPAALSAAVNVYNELFWRISPVDTDGLAAFADSQARLLSSVTDKAGSVLALEPGIPRSGEFISRLRSGLIGEGRVPVSPCTHFGPCPLPGGLSAAGVKARWCHFSFDTEDAPEELRGLSAAAGIPKERAVLSFILAGPVTEGIKSRGEKARGTQPARVRIISDSFPAGDWGNKNPNRNSRGRYGCSGSGLVLVTGSGEDIEASPSGAAEELRLGGEIDAKSGAFIAVKRREIRE